MDITTRLNLLPDSVRRQILQAVCETNPDRSVAQTGRDELHGSHQGTPYDPVLKLSSPAGAVTCIGRHGSVDGMPLAAGACVVDGFLTPAHATEALACAKQALAEGQRQAAIGGALPLQAEGRQIDAQARGDIMRWLHPEREEAAGRRPLVALLGRMEALRQHLARQGYDVGGRPTYQLACYPGGGARYVRHADASISCPTRTVTAIVYLNEANWNVQSDGGCLALYNTSYDGPLLGRGVDAGEPATVVAPVGGRLVVFESHVFHEVLPAHRHRYAVTVWFHRTAPEAACMEPRPPQPDTPAPQPQSSQPPQAFQPPSPPQPTQAPEPAQPPPSAAAPPPPPLALSADAAALAGSDCTASSSASSPGAPGHQVGDAHSGNTGGGVGEDTAAGGLHTLLASRAQQADPGGCAAAPGVPAVIPADGGAARPRIFVAIAAYRDPECQWTLHSLLSRADRPERVRVGVVWQVHLVEDAAFVRVAGARAHPEWLQQVPQVVIPHTEARGPCKARALAQALWDGEEYVLQIDSHMRMVSGWDTLCIEQLATAEARTASGKAVLSTYPLGYSGEGAAASMPDEATAPATLLCAGGFQEDGFLRTVGRTLRERPSAPVPSCFWAAGLSFARSSWLQEVPYCPHLPHLFFGEESYMLARMWTRGWDVFAPAVPLAFHQWQRSARDHTYQRDHATSLAAADPKDQSTALTPATAEAAAEAAGTAGFGARTPAASAPSPDVPPAPVAAVGVTTLGRDVGVAQDEVARLRKASQERVLAVLGRAVLVECVSGGGGGAQGDVSGRDGPGDDGLVACGGGGCGGALYIGGWGLGQVWGLGTTRTLEDMAANTGVDYATGRVSSGAEWGGLQRDAFAL